MGLLNRLGPKHLQIATQFLGSATCFGASAALFGVWATEWRAVLQYLPYYNGRYESPDRYNC